MDDRFKRRQPGTPRPQGTGNLPRQGGTGPLGTPNPRPMQALPGNAPQESPFVVRLDPNSQPGEFNFMIETPQDLTRTVPQSGVSQEAAGGIPPQLHPAVLDVLGFIFELDQNFEQRARKR